MNTVELQQAFHWHCDACGASNFSLPWKAELTDEAAEEAYRKFHMLDDWQELPDGWRDFEIVTIPRQVKCNQCGHRFLTKDESRA